LHFADIIVQNDLIHMTRNQFISTDVVKFIINSVTLTTKFTLNEDNIT